MSCSPCATSPRPPPASNSPEAGRAPGPSPPSRPGGGPVRVPGPRPRQPRPRTAGALLAPSSRPDPTTSSHSGHQRKSTTDRGGTSCSPCRRSALLRSALDRGAWGRAPPRCPCSRSTAWAPRVPAGPAVHLDHLDRLPAPVDGPAPHLEAPSDCLGPLEVDRPTSPGSLVDTAGHARARAQAPAGPAPWPRPSGGAEGHPKPPPPSRRY